jgi:hypothetical protein
VNTIQDVEYFARNFAALGGCTLFFRGATLSTIFMEIFLDFGGTAANFRATALRVQNLLSEITPDTPEANLPVEFNIWLRNLISTYPNGCTYVFSLFLPFLLWTNANVALITAEPEPTMSSIIT